MRDSNSINSRTYFNLADERERHGTTHGHDKRDQRSTPWYWRLVALAASWMILCGYLILPGLYARDATQIKIRQAVLTVFVVALLTAGYSFTMLLCFACRNEHFQAESVFLPALTSSAIGLISIAYNFLSSHYYDWGTSAITGTVVSTTATIVYGGLLLWSYRRIVKKNEKNAPPQRWHNDAYYSNFVQNNYPTTRSPAAPIEQPLSEDDGVNQQMALLLKKQDQQPSPDANSATYRIDLPEDREQQERYANSQELVGTPAQAALEWNRARADSRPDSLSEQQAWERWQDRGRTANRPSSSDQQSNHSRGLSREERRREIELGRP